MSFGPQGTTYNFDSYVTATPPTLPAAAPKQINGGDKKVGPPKPGNSGSNHSNKDSYYE